MRGYLLPVFILAFISLCRGTNQALIARDVSSVLPADLATAFRNASWIWTSEASPPEAPPGPRAFRRTFNTPSGKTATTALILLTVDNFFSFFVDGQLHHSGAASADEQWKSPLLFSVPLTSTSPLFGVLGVNQNDSTTGLGAAGLLAAIKIIFSDGTSTIITSDSSWSASKTIPDGWELPSSNESWDPASVLLRYGQGPWGTAVTLPTSFAADITNHLPNDLASAFLGASWIWTVEASPPAAPAGPRAFRKTYTTPAGKTATSALILIAVDNSFSLFVDGIQHYAGNASSNWQDSILLRVPLTSSSTLFAVLGVNFDDTSGGGGPAGLIAAIQILFSDGSSSIFTSDSSWIAAKTFADGWEQPSSSETWDPASAILPYGMGPWGTNVVLATSFAVDNSTSSGSTSSPSTSSSSASSLSSIVPSSPSSASKTTTGTSSSSSEAPSSTESFTAPNNNNGAEAWTASSMKFQLWATAGIYFGFVVIFL